jgi:hypothetical protein
MGRSTVIIDQEDDVPEIIEDVEDDDIYEPPDERQRGDDDGVEYGDPRDHKRGLE